jgi:superfamily II DNA or RNA helicase
MPSFEQFRSTFPEDSGDKGDRFEVFLCEWFLKNHPTYKNLFRKVWRFTEWPKRWSPTDIGTDLIAEDVHGKICAIQAKFYRQENSIPKGHVDSFLADSAREIVDYRLLIATTDRIGINAINAIEGQAIPVSLFLLNDFIDSPVDWPSSADNFNELKPREPHKPRPHQIAAIDDVCKKLNGRGQLIMACGTGKTLTGQRVAERLEAKTTLVLLPSLLLLSKTVSDWLVEAEEPFIFLTVCSDASVTSKIDDTVQVSASELGFPTTTDADEIAAFIQRPENKVIFSTYQSSPQIAAAYNQHKLKPIDLIIADEAHRCAGKVSSDFATVLSEDRLPAKNRIFMTATPRTYKAHIRIKAEENEIEIASMDDESVFGPVLHHLTFGQAIANDPPLLTDYRVVVVGVNEATYKEMVEDRTLIKTETGIKDDARSLATQVGLAKAVRDYDLKRVISFHSRINLAKNFATGFEEFRQYLKPDQRPTGTITYEHVSGKMPTSERTNKLRALGALEDEDRYLLANARCLSEGVDVPALDGVAFVDPKRSEIDIIQAVGRAIRLSDGKTTGTIVIPVFLSDSDDPDEVLSASEFDQVWKVVNALRAHDESLGEELDELRVKMGRQQKISLSGNKIVFDVHQTIGDDFIDAFETKVVETCTESWEFWFGLLQTYKEQHGHCRVPKGYKTNGFNLGHWVNNQRRRQDQLSLARIQQLDELGFVWDAHIEAWEEGFDALSAFKEQHGHCRVPKAHQTNGSNLGIWIATQRRKQNQLSSDRKRRLDDLGFVWDALTEQWEEGFGALSAFKEQHGHCLVPARHKFKDFNLGGWVNKQRSKQDQLSPAREQRLDDLGFIWEPFTEQWEEGFGALSAFKEQHGHCRVPRGHKTNGYKLGIWVGTQRMQEDQLSPDRKQRLDELGFIWDPHTEQWEEGFSALSTFKEQHGHCRVPVIHKFSGFNLGNWVRKQRTKQDQLSAERKRRLDELGFIWDPLTEQWEEGFSALSAFKEQHGHCRVAQAHKFNGFNLGIWIATQRSIQDQLSAERKQRLDELGFIWDPLTEQWKEGFSALSAFKEQHGHCVVPARHKFNGFNLGTWVHAQRSRQDQLSAERKQRLEDLGFVWDELTAKWENGFSALSAFKEHHGHCRVPRGHKTNGYNLGNWVTTQRTQQDQLSSERKQRLDELGFIWDPLTEKWENGFSALSVFKEQHGHCRVPAAHKFKGYNLGRWVSFQRTTRGQPTPERKQRLDELGFVWRIK